MMKNSKILALLAAAVMLSGCLSLGTRIGVGSNGVRGGVVVSGTQDIGGVTVGGSIGQGF